MCDKNKTKESTETNQTTFGPDNPAVIKDKLENKTEANINTEDTEEKTPDSENPNISKNTIFVAFFRNTKDQPWSMFHKPGSSKASLKNKIKLFINPKIVHIEGVELP